MNKVYLYPLWLRIWHWFNAICFFVLILTGLNLHYAGTWISFVNFEYSRLWHNIFGILLSVNYIIFIIGNILTGNLKHYIPKISGIFERLVIQGKYYLVGVFKGESHPYHTGIEQKFNPLQQMAYLFIMYLFMPLVVISGLVLFFPETAPDTIGGMGGIWPVAIFHISIGYVLSFFMFAHIYLATHGKTVTSNFKGMIDGYHEH